MKKFTKPTQKKDIVRNWHLVDVKGEVLGRQATQIAQLLMGKSKPYFTRHLDCGDYVVVVNAQSVKVTGKKPEQKKYTSYSGYPGGLKEETFQKLLKRKPQDVIRRAILGMLPKNKLRKLMMTRLYIYADEKHPHESKLSKLKTKNQKSKTHIKD